MACVLLSAVVLCRLSVLTKYVYSGVELQHMSWLHGWHNVAAPIIAVLVMN
jgi:hypothetical protein